MNAVALRRHATTPAPSVRRISAAVHAMNPDELTFTYALEGTIAELRLPPDHACRRGDRLWEHTCFEAFIASRDAAGYCELNCSPAREWAVYAFSAYRVRVPLSAEVPAPVITVQRSAERLELTAVVPLRPLLPGATRLRVALAAVVEEVRGGTSYWALHHPPGNPDFHHAANFVLAVAIPARC